MLTENEKTIIRHIIKDTGSSISEMERFAGLTDEQVRVEIEVYKTKSVPIISSEIAAVEAYLLTLNSKLEILQAE